MTRRPARSLWPLAAVLFVTCACAIDPAATSAAFVDSGDRLAANGQWRAATLEYRNALAHQPGAAATHYKLALAYEKTEEPDKALAAFVRVTELDATNTDAHLRVAAAVLPPRRYEDAEHLLNRVLLHEPRNVEAQVMRAEALDGMGRKAAAATQLEDALAIEPVAAAYVLRARWELRDGRVESGRAAVTKALELEPDAADAWILLGTAQWRSGEVEAAEASFRKAAERTGDPASVDRLLASFYLMTGRAGAAEPHLLSLAGKSARDELALADYYVGLGKTDAAEPRLAALLKDPALAGEAHLRRAVLARADDRRADATQEIEAAMKDPAVEARARIVRSDWLLASGDLAGALENAARAVALAPRVAEATYALAMVRSARGELAEAERALKRTRDLAASPALVDVQLARLSLTRGNIAAAVRYAQQAAADAPAPTTHALLARALRASGDLPQARRIVADARRQWPDAPELDTELGFLELAAARPASARVAFERALRAAPASPAGRSGLVLSHLAGRTGDVARQWLDTWRSDTPDDPSLAVLSAQLDLAEGDTPQAVRTLREAVQRTPENADALETLAALYVSQGDHARAIDAYDRITHVRPMPVAALTALGMLKQEAGDVAGATAAYERAVALTVDAGIAANNLAWLYAEDGRLDEAARMAEQAVRALGSAPQALHTLGSVYHRQRRTDAAIRQLGQAVQKSPDNPLYRYDLAAAYLSADKRGEARAELEHALAAKTDFAQAAEARRTLDQLAAASARPASARNHDTTSDHRPKLEDPEP